MIYNLFPAHRRLPMLTRSRLAALILLLSLAVIPAAAQDFGPGILPADTSFVVYSRGTAHAEATYTGNPMVQSWNSPDFAQFREQGINYLVRHTDWKVNGRPVKFSSAEAEQIFSFLKGPMMLGFSGALDYGSLAQASTPSTKQLMNAGGMFVIIDATGKTAQFDVLFKLIEANVPKAVTRTQADFSGVSIEKFASPNNTSFATRVGNYFVWSNRQKVIEDLVSRINSHSAAAATLSQDSTFQRCRANSDPDSISEVYFCFPDLTKTAIPAAGQFDTMAAMRSLHLDTLRAFCGSFAITQQGEHSRWAVLGDTTAGGIFDFFGANRSNFDTLALAPTSAFSYVSFSFDLPGIYKSVRSLAMAGLPQQQASAVQMAEVMISSQIGMPVADVLALVGGKIATIQLDPNATTPSPLIAVSISSPEKVALLFHKFGGNSIVEDSYENGVTLFKTKSLNAALPGSKDPIPPTPYYAVTPHFLLYGTDKQAVRKAAQSDSASGSARGSSLADSSETSALRAALPHDLLGLSISDYTHHDWAAEITKSLGETEKSDTSKLSPEDIQFFDTMKKFSATILGKMMLRRSVSGWWKDADGIHYEGFSQ
jgi:hypothetical protein